MKPKLCIGTANFGMYYNAHIVLADERKKIFKTAKKAGIHLFDTSSAYAQAYNLIKDAGFDICYKIHSSNAVIPFKSFEYFMFHDNIYQYGKTRSEIEYAIEDIRNKGTRMIGISSYEVEYTKEVIDKFYDWINCVQIPLNLKDRKFDEFIKEHKDELEIHIRSIFGRGELLETHTIKDCLSFSCDSGADYIVIGIQNNRQLVEILELYDKI